VAEIDNLTIDGTTLKNKDGKIVAEMNGSLDEDVLMSYARAFASSAEMFNVLQAVTLDTVSDFEQQYQSSTEFNDSPIVPTLGPSPVNIPGMPEWVTNALSLIARIKGEKGDDT